MDISITFQFYCLFSLAGWFLQIQHALQYNMACVWPIFYSRRKPKVVTSKWSLVMFPCSSGPIWWRMTEGAEGERSAAICVLQWKTNRVDSSDGGDDWRCRRPEKCYNLCSAMDNQLLKINYPHTVGWLQLQEVEVAFVLVWDNSCQLHDSCTGYSICADLFVLFHLQFSQLWWSCSFNVWGHFHISEQCEIWEKVPNLYFVYMLLEMCILP
jgi:hypothetical protein